MVGLSRLLQGPILTLVRPDATRELFSDLPPGTVVPGHSQPDLVRRVFETGEPQLSDVFLSYTTREPIAVLAVPVKRDGKVIWSLQLAMRNQETALGSSGDLRRGSNIGRGQVASADFFIIPDIANSDSNTGGAGIGAVAGSFLPGGFGALAGGLRTKKAQAQALITLVDARSTEQLYVAEGVAQKTDISFGGGAGGYGTTGFGALAGGGYADTDIGKVITAAYFNAFIDLVGYLQNASPPGAEASANAGIQAYTAKTSVVLRRQPNTSAGAVRSFAAGELVYPTGQKNGIWWEVDDENGNRGWVSSAMITPR
jgi:curli biogenesis system outer membrane secretion channel CsgG